MDDEISCRTGCLIGDRIIVLDRRTSRYLSVAHDLAAPSNVPSPPAGQAAILSWSDDEMPSLGTARISWFERPGSAADVLGPANGLALARLWAREAVARRRLRRGIATGLHLLEDIFVGDENTLAQRAMIRASHRSRRFWSADDRCLPRSIALASLLRERGSAAKLVVGVTAQPFTAHAWVQEGDVVLNDTLDHVLLFTPILVA